MRKENAAQKQQNDAAERVERRIGKPQDGEQVNVTLDAARQLSDRRDRTDDLLTALTAECLTRLQRTAASVAEHRSSKPIGSDCSYRTSTTHNTGKNCRSSPINLKCNARVRVSTK